MKRTLLALAIASLLAACSSPQEPSKNQAATAPAAPQSAATPAAAPAAPLKSGIDVFQGDPSVKAGDDFYRNVNGKWLNTFEIPADKPGYGSFTKVFDETQ